MTISITRSGDTLHNNVERILFAKAQLETASSILAANLPSAFTTVDGIQHTGGDITFALLGVQEAILLLEQAGALPTRQVPMSSDPESKPPARGNEDTTAEGDKRPSWDGLSSVLVAFLESDDPVRVRAGAVALAFEAANLSDLYHAEWSRAQQAERERDAARAELECCTKECDEARAEIERAASPLPLKADGARLCPMCRSARVMVQMDDCDDNLAECQECSWKGSEHDRLDVQPIVLSRQDTEEGPVEKVNTSVQKRTIDEPLVPNADGWWWWNGYATAGEWEPQRVEVRDGRVWIWGHDVTDSGEWGGRCEAPRRIFTGETT